MGLPCDKMAFLEFSGENSFFVKNFGVSETLIFWKTPYLYKKQYLDHQYKFWPKIKIIFQKIKC